MAQMMLIELATFSFGEVRVLEVLIRIDHRPQTEAFRQELRASCGNMTKLFFWRF